MVCSLSFLMSERALAQAYGNESYRPTPPQNRTAQAQTPNRSVVNLNVKVLMNVEADSYMAIFHLSQVGERVGQVDTLINERISSFRAELNRLGITDKDLFTDMLTFVPVYEYELQKKLFSKKYNEIPKGFELKKNVHVLFDNEEKLSAIVTAAAKNEIYDLVKVNYYVKDVESVYAQLSKKALDIVKKKEAFHLQMGVDLSDRYRYFSENELMAYPKESYSTYQAYCNNNLFSANSVNSKTKFSQADKNTTLFYDPMDYKGFDAVINPVILKPVVQFTYHINMVYERAQPMKPETKPTIEKVIDNKYYIIKPDGSLQYLDIK